MLAGTQLLSGTMGVKEYVQNEFDNVEAQIRSTNMVLFSNFWKQRFYCCSCDERGFFVGSLAVPNFFPVAG